ncbi:MAG: collagen-like protein [Prevotella sp.]|nr:collagen-like protein [Prevotella sp.]
MKKRIINGILVVALLFAASSAFVSCKDNDADVQTELNAKIAQLQQKIDAIQTIVGPQGPQGEKGEKGDTGATGAQGEKGDTGAQGEKGEKGDTGAAGQNGSVVTIGADGFWYIDGVNTGVPAKGEKGEKGEDGKSYTLDDVLKAVQDEVAKLIAQGNYASKDDIANLDKALDSIYQKVLNIFKTQVTSIVPQAIKNPVFGWFSLPIDVQSNVLATFYAEAPKDIKIGGKYVAEMGQVITSENAGTVYVTVNPNTVDFTGKILAVENSKGEASVITLSGLKKSDALLSFGATRADNGFYEATASINPDDVKKVDLSINMKELATDVKNALKQRNKSSLFTLAKDLYYNYAKNSNALVAYGLKATYSDELGDHSVYSNYDIANFAVKPLSFTFEIDENSVMSNIKDLENTVVNKALEGGISSTTTTTVDVDGKKKEVEVTVDITGSVRNSINKFLDTFNKYIEKVIENVNPALQPTLLVIENNRINHAKGYVAAGAVKLVPTTWSAELFAPCFKKMITVTCDGAEVLNTGVLDGSVNEVEFTPASGKTYKITYEAVDFFGNNVTKEYTMSCK